MCRKYNTGNQGVSSSQESGLADHWVGKKAGVHSPGHEPHRLWATQAMAHSLLELSFPSDLPTDCLSGLFSPKTLSSRAHLSLWECRVSNTRVA